MHDVQAAELLHYEEQEEGGAQNRTQEVLRVVPQTYRS
jgi:hypothetical protein